MTNICVVFLISLFKEEATLMKNLDKHDAN